MNGSVARIRRFRLSVAEIGVIGLGILTVGAFTYVGQSTQDALLSARAAARANEEINLQLAHSHLWLEELLAGDAGVDVERSVREPLRKTVGLCEALQRGGPSQVGPLERPSEQELAQLVPLCDAIDGLVTETDKRLATRATAGSSEDVSYDAAFDRALRLAETEAIAGERHIEDLVSRNDDLRFFLVVTIFLLFVLGFVLLRRHLSELERKSRELADAYEKVDSALQQARRFERLRSEMVSNISHELRTPLVPILGWSQLLSQRPPTDPRDVQEYGATIHRGAQRLLKLVEDFLRVATGPSQSARISRVAVEAVARAVADEIRNKGGVPRVQIDDGVEDVETNRRRLISALSYLADNAVKFGPPSGFVDIWVSRGRNGSTIFSIIDDGPGLPENGAGHFVELFVQGDGGSTRAHGGTGAGLFLATALAEELGGHLESQNEPGRGARFNVVLPVRSHSSE